MFVVWSAMRSSHLARDCNTGIKAAGLLLESRQAPAGTLSQTWPTQGLPHRRDLMQGLACDPRPGAEGRSLNGATYALTDGDVESLRTLGALLKFKLNLCAFF